MEISEQPPHNESRVSITLVSISAMASLHEHLSYIVYWPLWRHYKQLSTTVPIASCARARFIIEHSALYAHIMVI